MAASMSQYSQEQLDLPPAGITSKEAAMNQNKVIFNVYNTNGM